MPFTVHQLVRTARAYRSAPYAACAHQVLLWFSGFWFNPPGNPTVLVPVVPRLILRPTFRRTRWRLPQGCTARPRWPIAACRERVTPFLHAATCNLWTPHRPDYSSDCLVRNALVPCL